jgi:hypothetical protein
MQCAERATGEPRWSFPPLSVSLALGDHIHSTSDTSADTGTPRPRVVFGVIFGALLLVGNLLVLAATWQDKSWGALVMAIVVGPILNGAFSGR